MAQRYDNAQVICKYFGRNNCKILLFGINLNNASMERASSRIKKLIESSGVTPYEISKKTGISQSTLSRILNNSTSKLSIKSIKLLANYFNVSERWLSTGEKDESNKQQSDIHTSSIKMNTQKKERNMIPFYDNVVTVGGIVSRTADVDIAHFEPAEYIDTGDWFRDATAAMLHYEDSMDEYPPGCILALKEVKDWTLVVPGKDYLIETSEYRVTKRLQRGKDPSYITVYSTSKETYPDGRMIHEPFDIPWSSIRRILLILGYVVKKSGGNIVFNNNK